MRLADGLTLETLALWAMAALGVYHLVYIASMRLRRERFRSYDLRKPSNQLRFVMTADFRKKRVMGISEYRVFQVVESEVSRLRRGARVFAQTSLGEILQSNDDRAHSSINSKRVDIVVIAANGYPLVAVEYQGDGHYQGSAAARDAVKKEALRKAGVQYLEVSKAHASDDIRGMVRSALADVSPPSDHRVSSGNGPIIELATHSQV